MANAVETKPAVFQPKWCLLVHLGKEKEIFCDDDMESWGSPPQNAENYKAKTIIFDGSKVVSPKGWVANIGGQLYRITVPIFKGKASCKRLKNTHSYAVDVIRAQSLGTAKSRLFLADDLHSSRLDLNQFRSDCRMKKPDTEEGWVDPDWGFRSVLEDISFYDHYLSVRVRTNCTGGAHPTHYDNSFVYNVSGLTPRRMTIKDFPKAYKAVKPEVDRENESLGQFYQWEYSGINDFNFSMEKSSYQFEFYIQPTSDTSSGVTDNRCYHLPTGAGTKEDRARAIFIKQHPKLIPWRSAADYWIAPDLSTVAYLDKGKIVFSNGTTKSKPLPIHLDNIVGWQWFDSTKISKEAMKELGISEVTTAK